MPRVGYVLIAALLASALALAQQAQQTQQSGDFVQQVAQWIDNLGKAIMGIVLTSIEHSWYWISMALFWGGIAEIIIALFIHRWHWTRATVPGFIFLAIAMGVPLIAAAIAQASQLPSNIVQEIQCRWAGYVFHGVLCGGGGTPGPGTQTTTAIGP